VIGSVSISGPPLHGEASHLRSELLQGMLQENRAIECRGDLPGSSSDCRSDPQKLCLKNLRSFRDFIKKQNRKVNLESGEKQGTRVLTSNWMLVLSLGCQVRMNPETSPARQHR
jgi:hypothetical protein